MSQNTIKILFIGDIVGRPGRVAVKEFLPTIILENGIDFTIANGENLAAGSGMTLETYNEIREAGVDLFTSGNHIWKNKDIIQYLDDKNIMIIRPENYPEEVPGRGVAVLEKLGKKILVCNFQGRVFMKENLTDPFSVAKKISEENSEIPILIDFHAEATSEKVAFGRYLDGSVSAIVGTHTHIQTADEIILPKGTGYITDIGMTGPTDSILGVEKEIIITKFLTQMPGSHKVASGETIFNAIVIDIDQEKKICTGLKKISKLYIPAI